MPHHEEILGLSGYEIKDIRWSGRFVEIAVVYVDQVTCPHCGGSHLRKKDRYTRRLRHENWGLRQTILLLSGCKFRCEECSRYFNQRFPGIRPWFRSTERFRKEVFWCHFDGITRKRLAERLGIGTATVERWFHNFLELKISERNAEQAPRVLGIDEHFFTKRRGYATTLCDLRKHKVFDVVLGRSEASLEAYFRRLKGKKKVRVVCIDLSSSYRALVRKYFPNARIVADRFHVIRLVNRHFMATWRDLDPEGSKNRGLISLMRRHEGKLSDEQRERLWTYFAQHPAMAIIYEEKQKLVKILLQKHLTKKRCAKLIPQFTDHVRRLQGSMFPHLETLGNTLENWDEEIACMWRFTKNNGITEGFHNKMETISRNAYGFRNFENYRLRVRVMCA